MGIKSIPPQSTAGFGGTVGMSEAGHAAIVFLKYFYEMPSIYDMKDEMGYPIYTQRTDG